MGETLKLPLSKHCCWASLAANQVRFVLHHVQGRRTQPESLQCGQHMANITPALAAPPCPGRVFLHHLKMLFITGVGALHSFKATAVTHHNIHKMSTNMMSLTSFELLKMTVLLLKDFQEAGIKLTGRKSHRGV